MTNFFRIALTFLWIILIVALMASVQAGVKTVIVPIDCKANAQIDEFGIAVRRGSDGHIRNIDVCSAAERDDPDSNPFILGRHK
jgi:hypothetical protein